MFIIFFELTFEDDFSSKTTILLCSARGTETTNWLNALFTFYIRLYFYTHGYTKIGYRDKRLRKIQHSLSRYLFFLPLARKFFLASKSKFRKKRKFNKKSSRVFSMQEESVVCLFLHLFLLASKVNWIFIFSRNP